MPSERQLQLFVLTAKHQKLSAAAEKIPMTQSAASMCLAQLESQLGYPLFHREGKRLSLNDHGKRLLPKAIEVLHKLEALSAVVKGEEELQGDLHIGASSTIANHVMPAAISHFIQLYPAINLRLTSCNTGTALEKLDKFEVDLALVEGLQLSERYEYHPWVEDNLVVFCHPDHPIAQKKNFSKADLEKYPWVVREELSGTQQVMQSLWAEKNLNFTVQCVSNSSFVIKELVMQSVTLLGCLSRFVVGEAFKQGTLVDVTPQSWALKRHFYEVQVKGREYSVLAELFKREFKLTGGQ